MPEVAALLDQLVGGSYNRFGPIAAPAAALTTNVFDVSQFTRSLRRLGY